MSTDACEFPDRSRSKEYLPQIIFMIFIGGCIFIALRIVQEVRKVRHRMGNLSKRVSLVDVLSYRADLYFSSDPLSKPIALLCMTQVLILVGGCMLYACSPSGSSLHSKMWQAWIFIADSAAHAEYGGIVERIVSFILTICGMLVFGFLVGIVTDTISEKVDQLKKGKSAVLESGHTLILNWSNKVIPVIDEICLANASIGGGTVVVLAERDKEEMEHEILESLATLHNTKVVVRSGSPILATDLNKVAASSARAIIVMSQENLEPDESDAMALRVTLCLASMNLQGHVTVELSDVDNRHLIELVGRKQVETIVSHDLIGRIMIQCARQPGLARVLDGLLGFEGHEFYFSRHKELDGKTFEEALYYFPDAVVLGIKPKDSEKVNINPPGDSVFRPGDEVLVLAEDDDTYSIKIPTKEELEGWQRPKDESEIKTPHSTGVRTPERVLFIGWRRDLDDMIVQLDEYVLKGSELVLFSQVDIKSRTKSMEDGGLNVKEDLNNLTLKHEIGNSISRRHLQRLKLESFDSVLILADEQLELDVTKMDSRSLTTLLLIRDIIHRNKPSTKTSMASQFKSKVAQRHSVCTIMDQESWINDVLRGESKKKSGPKCTIISEILDPKTKLLIQSSSVSDFVASNELISKALAMVAERQEVSQILQEILSAEGQEVYMRPLEKYVFPGESLSFFEAMARCRANKEILIGYKLYADPDSVVLNPSNKTEKIKWQSSDLLITVAEDD
ncbi:hypothetical protein AAMO2058_001387400 [Amorphochlora amoebiformis]